MPREAVNSGIGAFLTGFLLLGSLFLLCLVVTFNPVNPTSVSVIILFTTLGLLSGVVAAKLVTQGELKILSNKGEFTLSNRVIIYAGVAGIFSFLIISFVLMILNRASILGEGFLLLAGLFTYFSTRAYILIRWETKNNKLVMIQPGTFTTSGKLHVYPIEKN